MVVTPFSISSRQPASAPLRSSSGPSRRSSGSKRPVSHSPRGTSSVRPRNTHIGVCVWVLTRPGSSTQPRRSTTSPAGVDGGGPTARIVAPSMVTAPGVWIVALGIEGEDLIGHQHGDRAALAGAHVAGVSGFQRTTAFSSSTTTRKKLSARNEPTAVVA